MDEKKSVGLNLLNVAINKDIKDNLAKRVEEVKPKAQDTANKIESVSTLADEFGFDDIQETFCTAWPKVYPVLNLGLRTLGWVLPPATVGLARTVLNAINTRAYPVICANASN